MKLRVKICGITQVEQGRAIVEMGATALGFICVPGTPRYIAPAAIQTIVAALPVQPETGQVRRDRVGVFLNHSLEEICRIVAIANLNAVQFHGTESPEYCQQVRQLLPNIEIIKAFRVRAPETLIDAIAYANLVDVLLLDAYHPHQAGGTGQTLDWRSLQQFQPPIAWFLSGGLNPENVREALSLVQPDGIDLSSGVESAPGIKNLAAVDRLFQQLNAPIATLKPER
jgi:phosphoribosylanthranilate isomerase